MKSTLSAVLLLGLVGVATLAQTDQQTGQQQAGSLLGNLMGGLTNGAGRQAQQQGGLLGGLGSGLGSMLNGQQRVPSMGDMTGQAQQQLLQQGPLASLMQQLQQLPQRGIQMVSQLMSGVRNMLPAGLGRGPINQAQMGNTNLQGLELQRLAAPLNELSQGRLPNLNSLTQSLPSGNSLAQNLPNLSQLTQQGTRMADNLVPGLGQSLANVLPRGTSSSTSSSSAN